MAVSPADRSFEARRSAPMKRIRTGGSKWVKERPSREDRGSFDSPPFPLWTRGQCPHPQLPPETTYLIRNRSPAPSPGGARFSGYRRYVTLSTQRSFEARRPAPMKRVLSGGSMCQRAPSAGVSSRTDLRRQAEPAPTATAGSNIGYLILWRK